MIANVTKFHAIIATKGKQNTVGLPVKIGNIEIKTEDIVKLLGVLLDNKIAFDNHISNLLKQASSKLNAIKRVDTFLNKSQKNTLCHSYVLSYFQHCCLAWHFGNTGNIHKLEKLHERVIRFTYNDYNTDYFELLVKNNLFTLYTQRLQKMCCEIFKIQSHTDKGYLSELLAQRPSNYPARNALELYVPRVNQKTYGENSFFRQAPEIWNSLSPQIQKSKCLEDFKRKINVENLPCCRCQKCCLKHEEVKQTYQL